MGRRFKKGLELHNYCLCMRSDSIELAMQKHARNLRRMEILEYYDGINPGDLEDTIGGSEGVHSDNMYTSKEGNGKENYYAALGMELDKI